MGKEFEPPVGGNEHGAEVIPFPQRGEENLLAEATVTDLVAEKRKRHLIGLHGTDGVEGLTGWKDGVWWEKGIPRPGGTRIEKGIIERNNVVYDLRMFRGKRKKG